MVICQMKKMKMLSFSLILCIQFMNDVLVSFIMSRVVWKSELAFYASFNKKSWLFIPHFATE